MSCNPCHQHLGVLWCFRSFEPFEPSAGHRSVIYNGVVVKGDDHWPSLKLPWNGPFSDGVSAPLSKGTILVRDRFLPSKKIKDIIASGFADEQHQ